MPPTTPNNNKSLTQAVKDGTNVVAARAVVAAEAKGDTPSKVSHRQLNFSKAKDIALTKAYINALDDPAVGNNQKGMDSWKKVHDNFVSLMEKEDAPPTSSSQMECMQGSVPKAHLERFVAVPVDNFETGQIDL
jgi:hypothetical protein